MLQDLEYAFHDSGDVASIKHHEGGPTGAGTTSYQYDALGRLVQDTANGYGAAVLNTATTYAWSPRGDILSKTGIGAYAWDATTQRLTSAGSQRFTWDVRGNMVSRVSNVMDGELTRSYRTEFSFSPENT